MDEIRPWLQHWAAWPGWWSLAAHAAPFVAATCFLVALVLVLDWHGRRLSRHGEWLRLLEVRIENLHKDRERSYVQALQKPRTGSTPIPPSLSLARTVEVDDSMILNADTRRYTLPPPEPEGEKDGDETE